MKSFFLFLGLSIALSSFAQTDYLVTTKGDTLRGRTKIMSYDFLDRVQVVVDKKKKQFTALEAKTVVEDGVVYHTLKYDNSYRYMRLIKAGFLSLYGFRLPNQSTYDGQFLLKKDGSSMEVPNLTFKKGMANFLSECVSLQDRIKNGDFGKKDLNEIIDLFNNCLQTKPDNKPSEIVAAEITSEQDPRMVAINSLITKVEATPEFTEKADVMDLLVDLRSKVRRKEILPNYITKDIKKYLTAQTHLTEDVDSLLVLLKK